MQVSPVFSYWFCEISKNDFFYRTPPVAASVLLRPEKILHQRSLIFLDFPVGRYLFIVVYGNPKTICEIWSASTANTLDWGHWCRSEVFIVDFEQISHIALVFSNVEQQANAALISILLQQLLQTTWMCGIKREPCYKMG